MDSIYRIDERSNLVAANEKLPGASTVFQHSTTTRLGQCEVCDRIISRYSCPKCELKTCSIPCIDIHKKELKCNGIRDRSKFMPLRNMSAGDFLNDYYFLEEATRFVQDRKHKKTRRYGGSLSRRLQRLRQAALQRNTTLRFLDPSFTRHKKNTTCFDWNDKKIYWCIEWIFCSSTGYWQHLDERCPEDSTLLQLLKKFFDSPEPSYVSQKKMKCQYNPSDIKLLLKAEGVKQSSSHYYQIDIEKSLRSNLCNRTIIEYPIIHVYLDGQPNSRTIIAGCGTADILNVKNSKRKLSRNIKVSDTSSPQVERREPVADILEQDDFPSKPKSFFFTDEYSSTSDDEYGN